MAEYIILDEFLPEEAKESADAQGHLYELVRCKDCKFQECINEFGSIICDRDGDHHRPEWFCPVGVRKEGEQE